MPSPIFMPYSLSITVYDNVMLCIRKGCTNIKKKQQNPKINDPNTRPSSYIVYKIIFLKQRQRQKKKKNTAISQIVTRFKKKSGDENFLG